MQQVKHYLACDLGAESGRLIAGTLDNHRLTLSELYRFENQPLRDTHGLHWNFSNLILEIKEGLRRAATTGLHFESISTDSWGLDYVLFDRHGEVIPPVYHYRDPRTSLGVRRVLEKVEWKTIFEETGIQYMPINTLFQLGAEDPARLRGAALVLGIADAANFFLCGTPKMEVSMASTFQLYNPRRGGWSEHLLESLDLPREIFPSIVPSGTPLGRLRPELAREVGLPEIPVIATCSHDTGAAVAGTPGSGENWAYLSSGTWSLMGVELNEPIITPLARELNFTNEIGFGNTVRLLKNISGLWLIQECRRQWAREGKDLDYGTLTTLAAAAPSFTCVINPTAPEFLAPENMPREIFSFCKRTNQVPPVSEGALIRSTMESLVLLYKKTASELSRLIGRPIERLHIVGGGSRNDLLNQWTATALNVPLLAGPPEATAAGNVLIQAIALGHIPSLAEGRRYLSACGELKKFCPADSKSWESAYERFLQVCSLC